MKSFCAKSTGKYRYNRDDLHHSRRLAGSTHAAKVGLGAETSTIIIHLKVAVVAGRVTRGANHADLMPGALTALEELGEVATLAIVSNGATQVQESRIAASGIGRFMDGVYISEKVGAAKPSPKLLDYAIRDLGLTNRSRVLMVGDDLLADIKGGINAGIDTCWVNFANEENKTGIQPKYTVHSYEELYRIVMEPEELENVGVRNRRHMNEG